MNVKCLASSSAGNCFIMELDVNGETTRIMVECGLAIGEIYSKLSAYGILLSSIKACLITHAHQDHCKSANKISSLNIPVFASKDTLEAISCKGNELLLEKPNRILNGVFVFPFKVEHDIDGAVGFIIKTAKECILFVNDHKKWDIDLSNFKPDYVFIECNYDHQIVYPQIYSLKRRRENQNLSDQEIKEINISLKQNERNVNSHCSLKGTMMGLHKLNLSYCQAIFLMHLSDRYANEYKMKNTIQTEFGIRTYVCKKDGGIK